MAETPFERGDAGGVLSSRAWSQVASVVLRWQLALVLIVLLGGVLRFRGLDWDQPAGAEHPAQMHPDERFLSLVSDRLDWPSSVGAYFDTVNSPLNPYNTADTHSYVYGTFPLFLVKAVSTWQGDDPDGPGNSYGFDVKWGRKLTALFDSSTVLLVFLLGSALFSRKVALAGALLYALAVLPTQLAHFWTMDPYVTFFAVLTLLLSVQSVTAERTWARGGLCVAIGIAIGLGLACKVTAWPLILTPFVAAAIRIGLRDFPRLGLRWRGAAGAPWHRIVLPEAYVPRAERPASGFWSIDVSLLCLSLAIGLIVFRIAQPYAFAGPTFFDMSINPQWRADIEREVDFQNGNVDFPPFVQFAGRTPFVTPLRNIVGFGLGPALGIAGWVALGVAGYVMFKRREITFLLPLVFAIAVFAFQGYRFVAFMRYFAPIYPILCLLAGWGLVAMWQAVGRAEFDARLRERARRWPWLAPFADATNLRWGGRGMVLGVFALTLWWALAFQNVYSAEHPRLAASRWIYANAPPGSSLTAELWDDSLPYALPNQPQLGYHIVETEPYNPDSPEKIRELVHGVTGNPQRAGLNGADFVVISSNRISDSVVRLEREYPATSRYYEALATGELGFDLAATFTVRPSFLGIAIDDSRAEESFTVYDHPTVRIYKKSDRWNAQAAEALLMAAYPDRATNLLPKQGRTNGLQFTPKAAAIQQNGGTFTDVFGDGTGWTSNFVWLWWLIWIQAVAFASLPWVTVLCRAAPDRGYGLSKLLGLASVVLPVWLLVAWGATDFSGTLSWIVFAVVVALGVGLGTYRWPEIKRDFRANKHSWLTMEALFLAVFFAFLLMRAFNPDTWHHPQGGEKPMELAYLTAVTRSTHLPPFDPWFGGGTMNYYYMGWFFMSVPIRALRILPEVAFNLGVPTFASLAAITAFSTVHNLVAMAAPKALSRGSTRPSPRPAIIAGAVGALFLVALANLDGAHQMAERLQRVNEWTLFEGTPVLGGAVGILGGLQRWLFDGAALTPFDWWRSSRVHLDTFDITEFPYWTFLFADLHPHLMGLPFFGLVIALSVTYAASVTNGMRRHGWALAFAMGVAVGLVRTVHTWDFPTAVLIAGGAIVGGQLFARGRWDLRAWDATGHVAIVAATVTVLFAPYTAHFEVFNSGLQQAPETTKANQYFVQFGLFLAITATFVVLRYYELARAPRVEGVRPNPVVAIVGGRVELAAFMVFLAGLTLFSWNVTLPNLPVLADRLETDGYRGTTVIALGTVAIVFLVNLLLVEWRTERNLPRALGTAMLALAIAIGAGIDVVTVKDDIVRMNTVFKFSMQAWQLYALGSAFATWYIAQWLFAVEGWRARSRPGRRAAAYAATSTAALLLFASTIFLVPGTTERQGRRFAETPATLDGLAYLAKATFTEDGGNQDPTDDKPLNLNDDRPIFDWLRRNVKGSPIVAEAVGPLYHWTGRISMNTGLPAVIGWDNHQNQQRLAYGGLIAQRRADTARFFREADPAFAQRYLRKYNVGYVVIGTEELVFSTPASRQMFATIPALTEVYRNGDYAIYHVDQGKLPPP